VELTDAALLKPCQSLNPVSGFWLVEDLNVACAIDGARRTPKLNRNDNEPDQPEDEEDESSNHDDGGKQSILRHEPDQHEKPEYNERCNGNVVRKVPG